MPYRLPAGTGLILLLLAGAGVYIPGLAGGFIFDDFPNLLDNPALCDLAAGASGLWQAATGFAAGPTHRPLTMLSFAVQVQTTGFAPWPMKLVNLLLHLSNGALLFFLVRRLATYAAIREKAGWHGGPEGLALAVTAAWLSAPVNVSSVLYVVQRMELLAALFTLAGLLGYVAGRERLLQGNRRGLFGCWAGLVVGTGLGTLAKESAVLTPLYAFVIEIAVYRFRTPDKRRDPHLLILYALLLVAPAIIGLIWLMPGLQSGQAYAGRPFDLTQRLWTEGRVLWNYLAWILFPRPSALGFYHDDFPLSTDWLHPWTTLPAALGLLALVGLGCCLIRRLPLSALGILWFLAGHTLTATLIPLELVFEHRNYLPALGILLATLSAALTVRLPLAIARQAAAWAWIFLVGLETVLMSATWGNPVMLAQTIAAYHPNSPRANYELGLSLTRFFQDPASAGFRQGFTALEKAAELPGAGLLPDHALIFLASRHGLAIEERWWQRMYQRVTMRLLASEDLNALYHLIRCRLDHLCSFSAERLGEVLQAAVLAHPNHSALITLYANYAANLAHDFSLALELMHQAVALQPRNLQYWSNLARLQIALGQEQAARYSLERIAELARKPPRQLIASFQQRFGRPWRSPYAF